METNDWCGIQVKISKMEMPTVRPTVDEQSICVSMICGEHDCEPSGVSVTFLV